MNRGKLASCLVLAGFVSAVGGCASGPAGEADTAAASSALDSPSLVTPRVNTEAFAADDYDAVFDAAVRELRDAGFRIARNDRRFGVITTYPKESPTMFEPWVGGNTTGDLARRSTLNHLRRSVTVTLEPQFLNLDAALPDTSADAAADVPKYETYTLTITATLEREQQPARYLTHSARGTIAADYREVPTHLAQRGIPGNYWEPAGEDPGYAAWLLDAVTARAASGRRDAQDVDTD